MEDFSSYQRRLLEKLQERIQTQRPDLAPTFEEFRERYQRRQEDTTSTDEASSLDTPVERSSETPPRSPARTQVSPSRTAPSNTSTTSPASATGTQTPGQNPTEVNTNTTPPARDQPFTGDPAPTRETPKKPTTPEVNRFGSVEPM